MASPPDTLIVGGRVYLPGDDPPLRDILLASGRIAQVDGPDNNEASKRDVRARAARGAAHPLGLEWFIPQ